MSTNAVKIALKKVKQVWATRPRSVLELYECTRDEIVLTPRFQWLWWWTFCLVTMIEVGLTYADVYCLMIMMFYIIFTLPCLRFCSVWTKLYQQRRNAKPPEEEPEEQKVVKQKKKKAMTEEEMLEATRKRQKNRKDGEIMFASILLWTSSFITLVRAIVLIDVDAVRGSNKGVCTRKEEERTRSQGSRKRYH